MQEKRVHSSDNTVIVNGIGKSFGAVDALRDVSLEVGQGEVVALLGPNGAGKTTMVDILSTLTRPDRGHASIAGFDVVSQAASVRRSIMLTGQQVALDEILTGRENLVLFGRLQGLSKSNARSRAEELLREFDLVHAADRRVGTYSGGMRRRIDIACGLVVRPEVVFLDEPTTGLDPRSRQTIWDLVAGFKNLGIATLLTTQYLEEADALSDRIIVIDHGVIVAEGTADQLKERTGGSYCEIVPRDLNDLPAIADALGSLLPEENRAALTTTADRIAIPAPGGANTLVEALSRLNTANIEFTDIALRRPSLDEVFLSLTKDSAGTPVPDEPVVGEQPVDIPDVTMNGSDGAKHRTSGRGRSWLASHSRALIMLVTCVVTCVNLLIAASLVIPQKDSRPADRSAANTSVSPASIRAGPPPGSAPSTPQLSLPSEPLPTPVPLVAPSATPSATTLQQQDFADVQPASPPLQAAVSAPEVPIASPPVAPVSTPQVPIASPPVAPVSTPQVPIASPPVAPPDPLQVILSPLLGALP
jgi:ABC-2 type transport system ATP-binding protein